MADKFSTATTYVASGGAIFFGLSANEFAAVVGASVAILTFFTNLYFKTQLLKIAREKSLEELGDG